LTIFGVARFPLGVADELVFGLAPSLLGVADASPIDVEDPVTPEPLPATAVVSPVMLGVGLPDGDVLLADEATGVTAGAALPVPCEPGDAAGAAPGATTAVVGGASPGSVGGDAVVTVLAGPPPAGGALVASTALGENGGGLPAPKVHASTLPGGGA
jgi:hypothetical protein